MSDEVWQGGGEPGVEARLVDFVGHCWVSMPLRVPLALRLLPPRKTKDRPEVRPPLVERGMSSLHDRGRG